MHEWMNVLGGRSLGQKNFVKASYQHLRVVHAPHRASICPFPAADIVETWQGLSQSHAGIWLNITTPRLCSASKSHTSFRKKNQGRLRSFTLSGLGPLQRAETTHSTSQGSLRHLLSLLKHCWSVLPVRAAKCFHSTLNLAPKPQSMRSKGDTSETSRFSSTIAGENSVFGTFLCCFSAQDRG